MQALTGFGRDFEGLVPKMNQYLMCTIHDIYIGMNEPGWKVSKWECLRGRGQVLAIGELENVDELQRNFIPPMVLWYINHTTTMEYWTKSYPVINIFSSLRS